MYSGSDKEYLLEVDLINYFNLLFFIKNINKFFKEST